MSANGTTGSSRSAETGAEMGDVTVAVLVTGPVAFVAIVPVIVMSTGGGAGTRPGPSTVPRLHVTVLGSVMVHVPCELVTAVGVSPGGSVSVTTTPSASAAPSRFRSRTFATLSW